MCYHSPSPWGGTTRYKSALYELPSLANDVYVSTSRVHELRQPNDINDKDQRKGDLTTEGLFHEGKTILDVGITHPTIDNYINTQSSEAPRGFVANKMATKNRS